MKDRWLSEDEVDAQIIAKQIGRNLRAARDALGWSQEKVARKAEISRETYRKAENADTEADLLTLYRIAEGVGKSLWEIVPEFAKRTGPEDDAGSRGSRFSLPLPTDDLREREIASFEERRYAREEQPEGLVKTSIG